MLLGYVRAVWQYAHHKGLVSELDPQKIRKESLLNGAGWKCTLWNVRNFITCWACRVFCWTWHKYKHSILPALCLQLSKTKQNVKMVHLQLAIPINAHQNANQKPIVSAPVYWAQCIRCNIYASENVDFNRRSTRNRRSEGQFSSWLASTFLARFSRWPPTSVANKICWIIQWRPACCNPSRSTGRGRLVVQVKCNDQHHDACTKNSYKKYPSRSTYRHFE